MCFKENCNQFLKDEKAERMFSDHIVIKQKGNHKTTKKNAKQYDLKVYINSEKKGSQDPQ